MSSRTGVRPATLAVRALGAALSALLVLSIVLVADTPVTGEYGADRRGMAPERLGALPTDSAGVPDNPGPAAPAAKAVADFEPFTRLDESAGSRFDPDRSRLISRSMFVEEYENPDGTWTLKQSMQPLNVRGDDGAWRPVDTTLTRDDRTGRWGTTAHPLRPSLAGSVDDPTLLSVQVPGGRAALGVVGATTSAAARIDGATAEYRRFVDGADLRYEITPGSVKETIVLHRAPPRAATWRFRLTAEGLTPRLTPDGAVELVDGTGGVPLVLPPIEAWDSAGDTTSTTGGSYTLEPASGGWLLTASIDERWQALRFVYRLEDRPA